MSDIIVSPFSNSTIRDWPPGHFRAMIAHLADRWQSGGSIRLVGTRSQAIRARDIVRRLDPDRVINDCGRLAWDDVVDRVRRAACVIGNNSGIPHLAAGFGVPTVCVFGGSHQRLEWRPMGDHVDVISRAIGCSPCHIDYARHCPFDRACLREIDPVLVADTALALMDRLSPALAA